MIFFTKLLTLPTTSQPTHSTEISIKKMSFVSRSAVVSVRPAVFVLSRNNHNNMVLARPISSSAMRSKTVAESTKDTLDSVSVRVRVPCTRPLASVLILY